MAKSNTQISIDPEVLKAFDGLVGDRNRSAKIQELMKDFNERHMEMKAKLAEPESKEQSTDCLRCGTPMLRETCGWVCPKCHC